MLNVPKRIYWRKTNTRGGVAFKWSHKLKWRASCCPNFYSRTFAPDAARDKHNSNVYFIGWQDYKDRLNDNFWVGLTTGGFKRALITPRTTQFTGSRISQFTIRLAKFISENSSWPRPSNYSAASPITSTRASSRPPSLRGLFPSFTSASPPSKGMLSWLHHGLATKSSNLRDHMLHLSWGLRRKPWLYRASTMQAYFRQTLHRALAERKYYVSRLQSGSRRRSNSGCRISA